METRSRKRAEASSAAASSSSGPTTRSSKRARLPSPPSVSTRSRVSRSLVSPIDPMDSANGSGSVPRVSNGRRGKSHLSDKDNSGKGKEKEHGVRVRGRDRHRDLGLDTDNGIRDDDDNDVEAGIGALHHNFTSASSALQGLLRKLGAGLDDLLPSSGVASASSSHQSGRLKKILSGIRAEGEEGRQIEALTQLCEMLSIGTEESLANFSVDSYVPVLVGLLNHESNPDIMLLAARALTHLCDVLPSSCSAVVHYGAVSCFCARLLTIEYMDLAEQSLQALKKISQEHPTACLRAGALMAVLSYLDFFSTGVQRVALSTAANMCKKLPTDAADFVMEAVPMLTTLLQHHDAKVLEHASVCLTRISEAFASSSDRLDELCSHGIIAQTASLISVSNSGSGQASLSASTYTGLIRLLSTFASGSPLGAKSLLLLGISGILKDALSGPNLVTSISISPALSRPPDQIFEMMNLANELLPPLPHGVISLPASSNIYARGSYLKKSPSRSLGKHENANGNTVEISVHEKMLNDQPELLTQFGMDLLPVLIQIHGSSVNSFVRHKCLSVLGKLLYFSNADMIQSLLGVSNISSFLAGILAWKDPHVLIPALQIAEILMEKCPFTFSKMFVREGVVHAVDELILLSPPNNMTPQQSCVDRGNDSVPITSSQSRRHRHHSDSSNSDMNSLEESRNSISLQISSPQNSLEVTNPSLNIRAAVSERAKSFKDKYFPSGSVSGEVGATDDLLRLRNLCLKLNSGVSDSKSKSKGKLKVSGSRLSNLYAANEDKLIGIVSEILSELSKGEGVSIFEFTSSGVVDALLNYFSFGCYSEGKLSEANLREHRPQALKRYKHFIQAALCFDLEGKDVIPLTVLVQKLQNALSSLERFPVLLSHSARSSGGRTRISSGLSILSQPVKLRLCRAQEEKSLRDYSSNIVAIDPLASLASVEDFLWPHVQCSDVKDCASVGNLESDSQQTCVGTSCHATRSRSSSGKNTSRKDLVQENVTGSSKMKGKAIIKPTDDISGPRTRNSTRRRAALDKDMEVNSTDGHLSSEDEEMDFIIEDEDIFDDEANEHGDVLGDHSLSIFTPEKVHDVKLNDPNEDTIHTPSVKANKANTAYGSTSRTASARVSDSGGYRSGNSIGSRGAKSFAAAAMAGLASSNGRRMTSRRDWPSRMLIGSNDPPRLVFFAGGRQLSRNLTIYQAIQRQLMFEEGDDEKAAVSSFTSSSGNRFWGDIYSITYQRADSRTDKPSASGLHPHPPPAPKSLKTRPTSSSRDDPSSQESLLDSILQGDIPCDIEKSNATYGILALLRVLEGLNRLASDLRISMIYDNFAEGKISSLEKLGLIDPKVPTEEFINNKLTSKLARQIQDGLALCSGNIPTWCYQFTKVCPFLFPFETRRQYFYSTAFGLSRALYRLQQQQNADGHGSTSERETRFGRLRRQKVRVSRNQILESAAKVMEIYAGERTVLEVEYFGEVGTGLGPTLEFYTLLSRDFQKAGLCMWRSSSQADHDTGKVSVCNEGDIVEAPLGLFPRPWPPTVDASESTQISKVIENFRLLGRVMAKALQDGRLLDLSLSTAFYKLMLHRELNLKDICCFDLEFGKTLQELQALVYRKQYLESTGNTEEISSLSLRGAAVEDLFLDFTLPGYPNYILKTGEVNVTLNNLDEYLMMVLDATLKSGIKRQMEAFRAGFNQVFDISSLQIFSPHELEDLLCGRRELWQVETLTEHMKFDHGYTSKSPAIINLLEIMGEFTPEQQRAFCQFVTGAPRLPPGGLAALNPRLTIVRKHSSAAGKVGPEGAAPSEYVDNDLPSVMTCANYLKLPPYSTKEIMYKKLLYAICEGQGSFDLS